MKITWLGQAGLLFETDGIKVIIDPYFSDSVAEINPANSRRIPVNESFLKIKPDVIILTHNHLDHTDPETLSHYLSGEDCVCVLASENAWQTVRKFGGAHNYIMFNRGTEWTQQGVRFRAVYAEHSDNHAIGVIFEAEEKVYYITGDTLYNPNIFEDLPRKIDYVFLPVNGVGNNMNMTDAKRFCEKISAVAIPLHCGLFDNLNLNDFGYENKIIPQFYRRIKV